MSGAQYLGGRVASESADSFPSPEIQHKILLSAYVGMTLAGATTIVRLALRFRRLGWDDAFACLALLSLIMTAVAGKIYYSITNASTMPQRSRVALYYIFAVTFDTTIWFSRLSMLITIIRLGSYQKRLYTAALLFVVSTIILVTQVFWVCEPQNRHNSWKSDPVPQCILGKTVAITQVTTDVFADIILVFSPLLLLRYIRSSEAQAQKIRLGVSFIVGGLTTIVSIVHAVYLLQNTQVSILVSNVELSVSVTISNFAVLVAALHQVWNHYHKSSGSTRLSTIAFESALQRGISQTSSEYMRETSVGSSSGSEAVKLPKRTDASSSLGSKGTNGTGHMILEV
ncbi:hypothetical protein L218DRAFT_956899 [Marasmius fiardii PR-910]|nr:hypothetical protein L218DRAFT_956899 [Marasmius fiardii PR-910]